MESDTKRINLALQGGGSHGAFTWGVLDYLLEDSRLEICAISGTSAGAMNAVVMADGLHRGGRKEAKSRLEAFWMSIAERARFSPIQRTFFDRLLGNWSLDYSPSYAAFNIASYFYPPQVFNPLNFNPLRDVLEDMVDFDSVRCCSNLDLFIATTKVSTGRVRVFNRSELTADVVMASACLPNLFEAIEIEGEHYWDGGYAGNPPLFPFNHHSHCNDIAIVQINPIERKTVPTTAAEINNRLNEITFNQSLLKELRAIEFVQRLLREGALDSERYRKLNIHIIENQKELKPLGASSKMNAERNFLLHLKAIGRETAQQWVKKNFDRIGQGNSVDLFDLCQGDVNERLTG